MRLRNDPFVEEKLAAYTHFLPDPVPGSWHEHFGNPQHLCLEIGMGRGRFMQGMSRAHPDWNFVAIDLRKELLWETARKLSEDCTNVALLLHNAANLDTLFDEGEVAAIYLNFSDPWPKKRHWKRRLTHPLYLQQYRYALHDGGEVFFRTDHEDFMRFSMASFAENNFDTVAISMDYHNSPFFDGITSEYEEKKSRKGPICYGHFRKV